MNFTTIFCDFTYLFLFLVVLGRCCEGFSLVAASRGYYLVAVLRLLIEVAPLFVEHGLQGAGFRSCGSRL